MRHAIWTLVLAVACGGGGGGASNDTISQEIGAGGGSLAVDSGNLDGAAIDVPANAVAANTTFTIRAGNSIDAGAGTTNVGPAVRFGPATTPFAVDVTVTIPYSPAQAGGGAVQVAQRDDVTGGITIHSSPVVDAANGTVSVTTDRFSTFQAFVPGAAATFDMTGFWVISTSNHFSTPPTFWDQDQSLVVEVVQSGNSVEIDIQDLPDDEDLSGTVNGATYSVAGGIDTVVFTLTDANTGTGTLSWTEDGIVGGADLTLHRQQSATFDITGGWNVTFSNNASTPPGNEEPNETIPVTFTQSGTTWTFTADSDTRDGGLSGAFYFTNWTETNDQLNDVDVYLDFTLSDADNGTGRIFSVEFLSDTNVIVRSADVTLSRQP